MRGVYTLLFYLLIPFILLRLFWRGFKSPGYWQRWQERFGGLAPLPIAKGIWIHAVSVGEVQATLPLVNALSTEAIVITTMTPTGAQRVQALFGDRVEHRYLPYDLPFALKRFLTQVRPRLAIIMETELWPNLLLACHQYAIPVILANARLSAQSAHRYRYLGRLIQQMLNQITVIAAQTQVDAERFRALGATTVHVTGNIKFDQQLSVTHHHQAQQLRQHWGQRLVWIAASTHEGEETQVLDAFEIVNKTVPRLLLVLVPRHPERFDSVAYLCQHRGYTLVRRSQKQRPHLATDIYLGDTLGDLAMLYATADVAFVGGTLVAVGGHNLLEPAAVGVPILIGEHVFECAEISQQLLARHAAQQVSNATQLSQKLLDYLTDTALRHQAGQNARLFFQQNQGASARLLALIQPYL